MIRLTIPGRLSKGRARAGKRGFYTPEETTNSETLIKWTFLQQYKGFEPTAKAISMKITAYYRKAKGNKMQEPCLKPDADNCAKVCADSLNGIAYLDDKQIVEMIITKKWGF